MWIRLWGKRFLFYSAFPVIWKFYLSIVWLTQSLKKIEKCITTYSAILTTILGQVYCYYIFNAMYVKDGILEKENIL